jgi:hypothetical protein
MTQKNTVLIHILLRDLASANVHQPLPASRLQARTGYLKHARNSTLFDLFDDCDGKIPSLLDVVGDLR